MAEAMPQTHGHLPLTLSGPRLCLLPPREPPITGGWKRKPSILRQLGEGGSGNPPSSVRSASWQTSREGGWKRKQSSVSSGRAEAETLTSSGHTGQPPPGYLEEALSALELPP